MIGKAISWLLDKYIVHTLANNRSFQKIALKIDNIINNNKKVMEEKLIKNIQDNKDVLIKENIEKIQNTIKSSRITIFIETFIKELRNEFKNVSNKNSNNNISNMNKKS